MPIIAKHQAITADEKLIKVLEIISKLHNKLDQDFMKDFIIDICKRYTDKVNEVNKLDLSSSLIGINKFEIEYMERILKEFSAE